MRGGKDFWGNPITATYRCDDCGKMIRVADEYKKYRRICVGAGMNKYQSTWIEQDEITENRPVIVCLCGSTRFYAAFQRANYEETMAGKIVLSVGFYRPSPEAASEIVRYEHHGENIGCTPEQKIALDKLHKLKIDLADEILVLNVGGYIGESTRSEIEHARKNYKNIRYLEPIA